MSLGARSRRAAPALVCGALLTGCGGMSDTTPDAVPDAIPGEGVVHTPPPNADSLHRLRVQLSFGPDSPVAVAGVVPLGGWDIEARRVTPRIFVDTVVQMESYRRVLTGGESCDDFADNPAVLSCGRRETTFYDDALTEAVAPTDVDGVAVFWLEQPGPYRFESAWRDAPNALGCWWVGIDLWDGSTPELMLELGLPCS